MELELQPRVIDLHQFMHEFLAAAVMSRHPACHSFR
jgi:hypothetical protein